MLNFLVISIFCSKFAQFFGIITFTTYITGTNGTHKQSKVERQKTKDDLKR